jgi:hypothetical protein
MSKTLELFKTYQGLFSEADEYTDLDATDTFNLPPVEDIDATDISDQRPAEDVGRLLKAFLHVPDSGEQRVATELQDQIGEMEDSAIISQLAGFLDIGVEDTKSALDDIQV